MRLIDSFLEKKNTVKILDEFDILIITITFAVQYHRDLNLGDVIAGNQDQIPDSHLYIRSLRGMTPAHFSVPHIGNPHDVSQRYCRIFNLMHYVAPDWSFECRGYLGLSDRSAKRRATIISKLNRLGNIETNPWHSARPVKRDRSSYCVSNYYFSPTSLTDQDYFNVTSSSTWPGQKMRCAFAWSDKNRHQRFRWVVPAGFGKKDICKGSAK